MGGNRKFKNEANNTEDSEESTDNDSDSSIMDIAENQHESEFKKISDKDSNDRGKRISVISKNSNYGTRSKKITDHLELS